MARLLRSVDNVVQQPFEPLSEYIGALSLFALFAGVSLPTSSRALLSESPVARAGFRPQARCVQPAGQTAQATETELVDLAENSAVRSWLYVQTRTLIPADRGVEVSPIDMIYAGIADGRFLGYFSHTE
eukprot:COSAG05_NODE_3774_length_1843_cov_2.593463_1_plen_128_part_10